MNKMTPRYARLLALVVLGMLMASGPAFAQTDYDTDNDNLIDITTLAQLNAMRWDLNGDGAVATTDTMNYNAAFPNAMSGMGCQATCTGYELLNNLDFDTNENGSTYTGTGASAMGDSGDDYNNGGSGWEPIGRDALTITRFHATFKGNGYIISNLFIKRTTTNDVGLFGALYGDDRIESVGVKDAYVYGKDYVGILVGTNYGTVTASWTSGEVRGGIVVGGLVGYNFSTVPPDEGKIVASYSHAAAHAAPSSGANAYVGGLAGASNGDQGRTARIIASYSTGAVTSTVSNNIGGLTTTFNSVTITASYWDTQTSGRTSGGGGTGQMTVTLKAKTDYTGIYANWNISLDGDRLPDNPWNFGTASQYPTLNTPSQRVVDYDGDNNGLIDVQSLLQLNAIRYDLNGDGLPTGTNADTIAYARAFPGGDLTTATSRMGCPSSGGCTGYELLANLDFDENNDGAITQADSTYWNSGAGFLPLGTYTGTFKGNNKTISNLYINRGNQNDVGLIKDLTGTVSGLGLRNVDVRGNLAVGGLTGNQRGGAITGCYVTGRVRGSGSFGLGGLVGHSHTGANRRISASYSVAAVTALGSGGNFWVGGLVGWQNGGTIIASYATGAVTVTGSGTKGGLVGRLESSGEVTASYATGQVTGDGTKGGLVGSTAGTVSNSYWDSDQSGIAGGKTTSELQSPTTYGATANDTYYNWNANLDGQAGNDDPWTFGAMDQYPALKYADMDTTVQFNLQPVVVTLALTPSSISESGGMSTVTATLSRSLSAATTITVRPVADAYTVPADSTITIAAGSTANASDTVVITAVNNTQDEPNRTVTMSAVMHNSQVSGRVTGTLTITDDDLAPMVTLTPNPASISENGAVSTVTASLSRPSSAATTITVRPVADAYTVGMDSTITIAAGSTANASDTVVITSVDNTRDEPARDVTVSVAVSNAQGAGSVTGTVTLTDDDVAPDVTMVVSPSSISETGAVSTITAILSHPSSAATTIVVSVTPVSPAVGGDYTLSTSDTLTVAAGQTTSTGIVTITTVGNNLVSGNKTVTVSASTVDNSMGAGSVTDATLTITDDDEAAIEVSAMTTTTVRLHTTESGRAETFTVTLASEPTGNVALSVVSSNTAEGTVSPSVLTFMPSNWNTAQTVTVTGQDDTPAAVDGNQNYTVTLSVNQTDTQDTNYDALTAIIVYMVNRDNDFGLDISTVTGQATEAGGSATFTVALLTQPTAAVTISVTSQDPSEGRVEPAVLTFTTSGWNTAQTVTVTGQDDIIDDGDVTWTVRLASSSGDPGYNTLSDEDVPVTTTDDEDAPTVTLVLTPSSISENGEVSTITATLSHPSSAITTITVSATPVSPATASDFTLSNADTLIIAATATTSTDTVTITAVDNNDQADDKTVSVSATANNAQGITAPAPVTLTLTDDESANLDIDGNGRVDLFTDIIMIIRYALSFREESLTYRALSVEATRTTHLDITAYIDRLYAQKILDVDRNGEVDLFTDIIMVIRYALSFREESLTYRALSVNAMRTTHQDITTYIRSLHPPSHFQ